MTYEEAVKIVYHWQYGDRGNFYSSLITLFQKADSTNRAKLFKAFPQLSAAYIDWCSAAENGDELFATHGLLEKKC